MDKNDTGTLLNKNNIQIQRTYFKEMCKLLGIKMLYRAPREGKTYNNYGELDTFYEEPIIVDGIFQENVNQWTMKKLGWNSELSEELALISVPYDTPKLQAGSLFIIPSGIDNAKGRVFKVLRMSTTSVYPASITCELGPVWENTFEKSQFDHSKDNFNLLNDDEEGN